jgi:hypothetical protein
VTATPPLVEVSTTDGSSKSTSLLQLQQEMSVQARCSAATSSFLEVHQNLLHFRVDLSKETRSKIFTWSEKKEGEELKEKEEKEPSHHVGHMFLARLRKAEAHSVDAFEQTTTTTMNDWKSAIAKEYANSAAELVVCTSKANELYALAESKARNRTNTMLLKAKNESSTIKSTELHQDMERRSEKHLDVLIERAQEKKMVGSGSVGGGSHSTVLAKMQEALRSPHVKMVEKEKRAVEELQEAQRDRDETLRTALDVLKGVSAIAKEEKELMIDTINSRLSSMYDVATNEHDFRRSQIVSFCVESKQELKNERNAVEEIKTKIDERVKELEEEKIRRLLPGLLDEK